MAYMNLVEEMKIFQESADFILKREWRSCGYGLVTYLSQDSLRVM